MSYSHPVELIWPIAELLRHDYKRSDYGKVILPLTVLRRLDCVLEPTKAKVLKAAPQAQQKGDRAAELLLNKAAGQAFHNRSQYNFRRLLDEPNQIEKNLKAYINGFSANIREIMEYFSFADHIIRLDKANLLFKVVSKFGDVNLHPKEVDNHEMGAVYEELIRRFSELSNETAGEHFTPREVIKLMVNLLFLEDREILRRKGIVKKLYDPACGTGGMLSVAEDYLHELNPDNDKEPGGRLELFGQEINPESYAICKADMVIKGNNAGNIKFGNSFTTDGLPDERFDYMLSNPPFGVEWKKVEEFIRDENENFGHGGRFGAGLPRVSDGSLLFLQHMLSKRKEGREGTRIGVVFNGSPLFSGGAGSGESEIRRWIIENDWLEAIVAMPDQLFYNTGISTYIWIVTNRKSEARKGKIQLVSAAGFFHKMRKSLGNKRNRIGDGSEGTTDQISEITRIYGDFQHNQTSVSGSNGESKQQVVSKIFDNEDFGYRRITVERPLRLQVNLSAEALSRLRRLCEDNDEEPMANLIARVAPLLGQGPHTDYNAVWGIVTANAEQPKVKLTSKRVKLFREACCIRDEAAERIYAQTFGIELPSDISADDASLFGYYDKVGNYIRYEADASLFDPYDQGNYIRYEADPALRDFENVPFKGDIKDYFRREVAPHVPEAWINDEVRDEQDDRVGKVGYEIPFTRHFYEYKQPPKLEEIEQQIIELENQIQGMLKGALA
jgi:type I restriction enzyme M protein